MKKEANKDIRNFIKSVGLSQWEVAELVLGIGESSFSRLLRRELTPEKKQDIIQKIQKLSRKK